MNLSLAILQALQLASPNMMPEKALLSAVRLSGSTGEDVTLASLRAELSKLEDKSQAVGVPNEDTGTRWKIADAGVARLSNANL